MTRSLLRVCAALALIVTWTLVAPASQQPTVIRHRLEHAAPTAKVATPPAVASAPEVGAPYFTSAARTALVAEETPSRSVHPWRRLLQREVTRGVVVQANAIIRSHSVIGEEVPFTVAGERFLARIEEHYHPPGGDKFPWGPHPGVSVFTARPMPNP